MTRARHVFGPGAFLAIILVSALIFAITADIKAPRTASEVVYLRVLVSILVSMLLVAAVVFVRQADRAMRGSGDMYRWAESMLSTIREMLIENPDLARNDALRQDLLKANGLDLWPIDETFRANLDEIRDGTSPYLGGHCCAGGRYKAVPPPHHSQPDGGKP